MINNNIVLSLEAVGADQFSQLVNQFEKKKKICIYVCEGRERGKSEMSEEKKERREEGKIITMQ